MIENFQKTVRLQTTDGGCSENNDKRLPTSKTLRNKQNPMPGHSTFKLQKSKDKEKNLKPERKSSLL